MIPNKYKSLKLAPRSDFYEFYKNYCLYLTVGDGRQYAWEYIIRGNTFVEVNLSILSTYEFIGSILCNFYDSKKI